MCFGALVKVAARWLIQIKINSATIVFWGSDYNGKKTMLIIKEAQSRSSFSIFAVHPVFSPPTLSLFCLFVLSLTDFSFLFTFFHRSVQSQAIRPKDCSRIISIAWNRYTLFPPSQYVAALVHRDTLTHVQIFIPYRVVAGPSISILMFAYLKNDTYSRFQYTWWRVRKQSRFTRMFSRKCAISRVLTK